LIDMIEDNDAPENPQALSKMRATYARVAPLVRPSAGATPFELPP
jgi:hypothetical protein